MDNVAMFPTREAARAAADAAMPRRKRNRPYPQGSGYHSARAGHDVWIVCAPSNLVMLDDGTMYDFQRKVAVRG